MSRGIRVLLGVILAGGLLLSCLAWPRVVVQAIVMPLATVVWLLLRLFVLSIDQHVYWWGTVAAAALGVVTALVIRIPSGRPSLDAASAPPGDPARRWRDSLRLGVLSEPPQDALRREVAWMLAAACASQRPGFAPFQVREALVDGRIPLPEPVYEFLFSATRPAPVRPPFLRNPRAWVRRTLESAGSAVRAAARRRRGAERYFQSVSIVLDFMELPQEMTHGRDDD